MRPVVLQHQCRPLHGGAHPQFCAATDGDNCGRCAARSLGLGDGLALDDADIDHIIGTEIALDAPVRRVERQHAAVSNPDAEIAVTAFAAAFVENNGRLPMHVGKRQLQGLQSLLPRRHSAGRRTPTRADELLDCIADIGLRPAKLDAAGVDLIPRKPFLQCRLGLTLQGCVDGRVDGVRGHPPSGS